MNRHLCLFTALTCAGVLSAGATPSVDATDDASPGFFITSVNPGDGANLGGLAGADAHCAALAGAS